MHQIILIRIIHILIQIIISDDIEDTGDLIIDDDLDNQSNDTNVGDDLDNPEDNTIDGDKDPIDDF